MYKEIPYSTVVHIKPLAQGLTNQRSIFSLDDYSFKITNNCKVYRISIVGTEKVHSYVIRVYGHDSGVLVDRGREIYVLSIVDTDLLKARFQNGIILRYNEGESLVSKQLIDNQEKIARTMANLHKRPLFRSLRKSKPENEFFEEITSWLASGLLLKHGVASTEDFKY